MQQMVGQIQHSLNMDLLSTMMMNWEIGTMTIISSLKLNQECPHNCRRFKVQIAYWSAAIWSAILLEWQICMKQNSYEIQVFDTPMSETLIYITHLTRCAKQKCILDVELKFADSRALRFPPSPKASPIGLHHKNIPRTRQKMYVDK